MSVEAGVEGLEPPTSRARSPRRERQTVRRRVRSALAVTACLIGIASPAIQAQTQTLDQAQRIAELARFGGLGTSFESGDRALLQSLRDARNDLCVVFLASHPDDQYLLPATYLRLDQGYRVHVILATRGEGGQNSAGAEVADELGARRTIETEACARRLGLEIWHLNRRDAGFCRDAESTFEDWPRERTIKDLARLLRSIRPDLVLTTHHPEETHGHDQALLDVLEDSVELAESLEFDTPGRPPIRVHGVWRGASPGTLPSFSLPTTDVDVVRGQTFVQIAHDALQQHRSQAPIRRAEDFFANAEAFTALRDGTPDELYGASDLFLALDGVLPEERIAELRRRFDVELLESERNRESLIRTALELRSALDAIDTRGDIELATRVARRHSALGRVIWHALGLNVRPEVVGKPIAFPGDSFDFNIDIATPTNNLDFLQQFEISDPTGSDRVTVTQGWDPRRPSPWRLRGRYRVPDDALRLGLDPLDRLFRRERFEMPFWVNVAFRIGRDSGSLSEEVVLPLELPITVRPAVELQVRPDTLLVPLGRTRASFNVRIRNYGDAPLPEKLEVRAPAGFRIDPAVVRLDPNGADEQGFRFEIEMPEQPGSGTTSIRVRLGDQRATVRARHLDVRVPENLRVGLIQGVDDASRNVLRQFGVTVIPLTESDLPLRGLDDLDTILIDVRALAHHRAARAEFNRLVDFARRGGRLVILYHKDTELAPRGKEIPFHPNDLPFEIGRGRVTEEDAPVRILAPGHPILTNPNQIDLGDFDGWVQERGLYFPAKWSAAYTPLLASNDEGFPEEQGLLLHAPIGDGEFVYCALALHRQLKRLHPGACRLFANLITPAEN